ncbi:MAG TPA: helix-turn-helix domain-containing protein, partial [Candidatus Obscuribacterales bacterium]
MDVISVEQAADYLQCAASRIYRLIHNQQLSATKINRYWYICQKSLRQFCWHEMLAKGEELLAAEDYAAASQVFDVLIRHFPERIEGYLYSARA